ncbi:unnamed protein product, partial [Didymodactylos carnosus]
MNMSHRSDTKASKYYFYRFSCTVFPMAGFKKLKTIISWLTMAIVDTGSAISLINQDLLKTIHHKKFISKPIKCQAANSSIINSIGEIELEIKIASITTYIVAQVTTNLITGILLGNDWINQHKIHLLGDEQRLTVPNRKGIRTSVPYIDQPDIHYPVYLAKQITIPASSQRLIDVKLQLEQAHDLIFQPLQHFQGKLLFLPNTMVNVSENTTKILLINAQNRQRTLAKNTKVGIISRDPKPTVCLTMHTSLNYAQVKDPISLSLKSRTARFYARDFHRQLEAKCNKCHEQFLSGNELQQHLREKCYPQEIRDSIQNLTQHLGDPNQKSQVQDIL